MLLASSNARKLIERIGVYSSQTRDGEASLKNKVAIPQSRRREMKRVGAGFSWCLVENSSASHYARLSM